MEKLSAESCAPCREGASAASPAEIREWTAQLPEWKKTEKDGIPRLERVFQFKDFLQALDFTNQVGAVAEKQDHHPSILTEWGKVTVSWWTHKVRGLHRNDFIMAAKTDSLFQSK